MEYLHDVAQPMEEDDASPENARPVSMLKEAVEGDKDAQEFNAYICLENQAEDDSEKLPEKDASKEAKPVGIVLPVIGTKSKKRLTRSSMERRPLRRPVSRTNDEKLPPSPDASYYADEESMAEPNEESIVTIDPDDTGGIQMNISETTSNDESSTEAIDEQAKPIQVEVPLNLETSTPKKGSSTLKRKVCTLNVE